MKKSDHITPEERRLKLKLLHPHPLQALFYAATSKDEDDRFVESLRPGQRDAIIVVPIEGQGGRYLILDGHRRVWAAGVLGWAEIKTIIRWDLVDADETKIESAFLQYNLNRRHIHKLDQARIVLRLYEIEKKRPRDSLRFSNYATEARDRVGRLLGMSGRHLQRLFSVLLLPLPVQRAVRDGRLPMVMGEQVERLPKEKQAEIAQQIEAGKEPKSVVVPHLDAASVKNNGANRTYNAFLMAMKRGCVRLDRCIDNVAPHNIRDSVTSLEKARDLLDRLLARGDDSAT